MLKKHGLTLDEMHVLNDDQCNVLCEIADYIDDHAMHAQEDAEAKKASDAFFM